MVGLIGNNTGGVGGAGVAGVAGGATGAALVPGIDAALSRRQEEFSSVIARAKNAAGRDRAKAAREAAEQFVASSLVQPILAQLRSTNQAAAPFAPTQGERAFQQMADAQTAIGLVRRSRGEIVDRIAEAIERRAAQGVKA
jgi:Rod binding domain-containing protein